MLFVLTFCLKCVAVLLWLAAATCIGHAIAVLRRTWRDVDLMLMPGVFDAACAIAFSLISWVLGTLFWLIAQNT